MISLHGNHIPDVDDPTGALPQRLSSITSTSIETDFADADDISLKLQDNGQVSEAFVPLDPSPISTNSATNSVKRCSTGLSEPPRLEILQTDVLKLSSHLAQVQFRLEQLRFHTEGNGVLDKQLTDLSEFIDMNLSAQIEMRGKAVQSGNRGRHYQALISDLKGQLQALEKSALEIDQLDSTNAESKDKSRHSSGEPTSILTFTKSMLSKLKTNTSLASPYANYQSVPVDEPDSPTTTSMSKNNSDHASYASLLEPEEITELTAEIKYQKQKETDEILKKLATDPIALGRILIHGIQDKKLIRPPSSWPLLLDIDNKILKIPAQGSYGESISYGAKNMFGAVKTPLQTGACMKHIFSSSSQAGGADELTDHDIMSKAWLVLCHFFSEVNGADMISNPRYTTMLAFNYPVKFPEEISFAREFYRVMKKHQTTNHDIGQMFATFCLGMSVKHRRMQWFELVFEELGEKGYYEAWAGHLLKREQVRIALSSYGVEDDRISKSPARG